MRNRRSHSKSSASLTRRDFGALAAGGMLLSTTAADVAAATTDAAKAAKVAPLDIAESSFFWVGIERITLQGGSSPVVNGKQMYVEYQIPAKVKHPYPIVLIHGGGGQGLDWIGTPDGRRGWAGYLLEAGYKVYVVDRPGHGRSPYHPDLHGPFGRAQTLESISSQFTPQRAKVPGRGGAPPAPNAKLHNQWPGTGEVGAPELAQMVASQGGSFGNGMGIIKDSQVSVWQKNAAELLDKIGPAIFMTHSAGGPFGFYAMEARPNLVKGVIVVEGAGGSAFTGQNRWGLISLPVAYDPPVTDPSQLKSKQVMPSEADAKLGIGPYNIQEEPARKLRNWKAPIAIVTAEASFVLPNPGAVAYLKQAGCFAEEIRLADHGIHGNGHAMMCEKNNREALQPILDWMNKNITAPAKGVAIPGPRSAKGGDTTAMKLADQGFFWVGIEQKKVDYGTILVGPMYVQYMIPQQVKHPVNVVLVHGGAGQGTHYMGRGDGEPGWAHYFVQAGYKTYVVDRPGHGRPVYHPDSLGPIGPVFTYASVTNDFKRAAQDPNRRWMGTGDVGDPHIDQFQAGQNSTPQDNAMAHKLWASRGAEMLDKIGPSTIMVHSAGGPFSWLVANERPKLVKAIVNVEGAGAIPFARGSEWGITDIPLAYDPPVTDPKEIATRDVAAAGDLPAYKLQAEPARKLKNLQGIPIIYVTAERSGRVGAPVAAFLKQAGCDAEHFSLKEKGILGNGHFMMLETNRKQVLDAINGWLTAKVKA